MDAENTSSAMMMSIHAGSLFIRKIGIQRSQSMSGFPFGRMTGLSPAIFTGSSFGEVYSPSEIGAAVMRESLGRFR